MERLDFTKKEDVEKIEKRIRYAFNKVSRGLGSADDCVQEILCRMLEGKHQHSTIDQAVIDYLRATHGNPRMDSYSQRQNLERAVSVGPRDLERLLRLDFGGDRTHALDFDECSRWLGDKIDKASFALFYKWGMNEAEIGHIFGFSESRVSQRLARVQKRISARIKAQKGLAISGHTSAQVERILRPEAERQLWGVGEITFERMETGEPFGVASFNEKSF